MKLKPLLLLVLALFIVACGGGDDAQPDNSSNADTSVAPSTQGNDDSGDSADNQAEQTIIQFAVNDFELGSYDELIDAFEEENVDVRINLISINQVLEQEGFVQSGPSAESAQLLAQSADVFASTFVDGFTREKIILDLTPFIEADDGFSSDDFYANSIDTSGGREVWVLPLTLDVNLISFDKALFDEAGVTYPQSGWSWDEFVATAESLTITENGATSQYGFVDPFGSVGILARAYAGEPLLDLTSDPPIPQLETDALEAGLQFYLDLSDRYEVMPDRESTDDNDSGFALPLGFELITSGQAAMWLGPNFGFNNDQDVGAVAVPVDSADDATTLVTPSGLVMSAGTGNPDAAWRWMAFLSGQDQATPFFFGGDAVPARESVAAATGYWDDLEETRAEALRFALDHSYTIVDQIPFSELSTALVDIDDNGLSVREALAEAQLAAENEIQGVLAQADEIEPFSVVLNINENASVDATEIVFSPGLGAFDLERFRTLADEFTLQNPDIVVRLTSPDFRTGDFSFETIASNADCFSWFSEVQNPEHQAVILPIDPFIDADASFDPDDIIPGLRDQFTVQGQLWGIPASITPIVIEYNKELFDEKGVAYPSSDWTLDQFLNIAIDMTEGDGLEKTYGFVPDAFESNILFLMLERLGATYINNGEDPPTVNFESAEMISAMRWYADLYTTYEVKPAFITDPGDFSNFDVFGDRDALIFENRAAMWTSSGGFGGGGDGGPAGAFGGGVAERGVVALPRGVDGAGSGFTPANGYFITSSTPNRRECWEWVKFISASPEIVDGLPGRISVAESAEYRNAVGEERADAYLASVTSTAGESTIFQLFAGDNDWIGNSTFWIGRAHQQIIDGEASVEDALANAQAIFDQYRGCIIANDGLNDQEIQDDCLQEVDPTIPVGILGG